MSTEKDAYRALKRSAPGAFIRRVENMADTGTPDCFYCHYGKQAWIELKIGTHLKRADTVKVRKWRPQQHAWLTAYTRAGGRGIFGVYLEGDLYLLLFSPHLSVALREGVGYAEFLASSRAFMGSFF